jgi:hypothetical protein
MFPPSSRGAPVIFVSSFHCEKKEVTQKKKMEKRGYIEFNISLQGTT